MGEHRNAGKGGNEMAVWWNIFLNIDYGGDCFWGDLGFICAVSVGLEGRAYLVFGMHAFIYACMHIVIRSIVHSVIHPINQPLFIAFHFIRFLFY